MRIPGCGCAALPLPRRWARTQSAGPSRRRRTGGQCCVRLGAGKATSSGARRNDPMICDMTTPPIPWAMLEGWPWPCRIRERGRGECWAEYRVITTFTRSLDVVVRWPLAVGGCTSKACMHNGKTVTVVPAECAARRMWDATWCLHGVAGQCSRQAMMPTSAGCVRVQTASARWARQSSVCKKQRRVFSHVCSNVKGPMAAEA
jgi:hypothetical protein